MKAVRFHVVIGNEKTLLLPPDVQLVPGPAEVIVLQTGDIPSHESEPNSQGSLPQRLARKAQELKLHGLPADLADNHDHYLHGLPKGIDKQ